VENMNAVFVSEDCLLAFEDALQWQDFH